MKIRTGFVSNSSTSSFICCVTKNIESGMDLCLSDCGMVECCNGHAFYKEYLCMDEFNSEKTEQDDIIEFIKEIYEENPKFFDYKWNCFKPLEEIEKNGIDGVDWSDFLFELDYAMPKEACPICTMKNFMKEDLLKYIINKDYDGNIHRLEDEVRIRFSNNGDEFFKFIKERNT